MEAKGVQERCQNCGAMLAWHPETQSLRCDACGTAAPQAAPERAVLEHELSAGLAQARRGQLAPGSQSAKCTECGAAVEFAAGVTATRCSFCDAPMVLAPDAGARFLPESMIPFGVGRDAAVERFRGWLGKLWLRPSDLKHRAQVADIRGVYLPYWTFDAEVASTWRADAGWYYYEEERRFDDMQQKWVVQRVQRTRWQAASGAREDSYDDWLVCASKGVPASLEARAGKFDTVKLIAWSPAYLAGFQAESYAIDLPEAWERGRKEICHEQSRRCEADVPGDTHRFFSAQHRFSDVTWKHILAPLWIAAFRYRDKVYRFLVNGQTGSVSGEAPWSVAKISILVLAIVGAIVALVLFLRSR